MNVLEKIRVQGSKDRGMNSRIKTSVKAGDGGRKKRWRDELQRCKDQDKMEV